MKLLKLPTTKQKGPDPAAGMIFDEFGFTIHRELVSSWWHEQSHNRLLLEEQALRWEAFAGKASCAL